jgi:hypothetical protein
MSTDTNAKPPTLKKINEIEYSEENMKLQTSMMSIVDAFCQISAEMFTPEYKQEGWSGIKLFDSDTGKVIISKYPLLFAEMTLYCLKDDNYETTKYKELYERLSLGMEYMEDHIKNYILINMLECHTNYEAYKADHTKFIKETHKTFLPMIKYLKDTNQYQNLLFIKALFLLNTIVLKDIYVEYEQENFDKLVQSLIDRGVDQENAINIASLLPVEVLEGRSKYETLSNNILYEMIQKDIDTGLDKEITSKFKK